MPRKHIRQTTERLFYSLQSAIAKIQYFSVFCFFCT